MKLIRKSVCVAMALLMLVTMTMMSGCSTPAVTMTVDGKDYSTGEYLANLYNNFYNVFYSGGLYQYASYGMNPWEQEMTYGEDDAAVKLQTAAYITQLTKDSIVRQKAVENLMAQYGITISEEKMTEFETNLASYKESEMLTYGFNKEHYKNMYIASNLNEQSLFYGLYDEGGQKALAADEIRDYFDNNFVAYKAITISMKDSEGNEFSDADKEATKQTLQTYLDQYTQSGDFDAVITQYNADTAAAEEAENAEDPQATTTTAATETTTAAATAETTVASGSTTVTDAETTAAETTTTTAAAAEDTEEETDPNLQQVNTISGDEAIVKAVLAVPENTAQIIEYTSEKDGLTAALVLRLNTEEAGGEGYYDDQRQTCIYGMKFDEFDEEVKAVIKTLTVTYNDSAIGMCDPRSFDTTEYTTTRAASSATTAVAAQ